MQKRVVDSWAHSTSSCWLYPDMSYRKVLQYNDLPISVVRTTIFRINLLYLKMKCNVVSP